MKHWLPYTIAALASTLAVAPASAAITMNIQAFIDGRDLLVIQGNTMQWHHLDYAAVGRILHADGSGRNDPTIISTALDGVADLTNYNWYPDWPEPVPAEIRYPAFSSVFTGLSPSFPMQDYHAALSIVTAREHLSIFQQPSAANGYTLVLDFNDDRSGGAVWYEANITLADGPGGGDPPPGTVPEPSTWAMLVLGFAGIGVASRRAVRRRAAGPR